MSIHRVTPIRERAAQIAEMVETMRAQGDPAKDPEGAHATADGLLLDALKLALADLPAPIREQVALLITAYYQVPKYYA